MGIDVAHTAKVSGGECVGCFNCVDESGCPADSSSLALTWFGKRVNPLRFSVIALIVYVLATSVIIFVFGGVH